MNRETIMSEREYLRPPFYTDREGCMVWGSPALTAEKRQEEERHAFERFRAEWLRRAAISRTA